MDFNKGVGILSIILGLIFIIFPMFSAGLISVIVGLSLLFFGISALFMGFNMRHDLNIYPKVAMVIGAISIILGFLFIFYIDAISFLVGIQFYLVGFIMIIFGITGLFSKMTRFSKFTSIFILLMGVISIALATFAISQPIYIAIIIGIVLIIEGITFILD